MIPVVLTTEVTVSAEQYNESMSEVTFWGTLSYGSLLFVGLPFLRLNVEQLLIDVLEVGDTYHTAIPYLKHSHQFRQFMVEHAIPKALKDTGVASSALLKSGLHVYASRLREFSPTKSTVAQAKRAVNLIDAEKQNAIGQARAVLIALGITPNIDIKFFRKTS